MVYCSIMWYNIIKGYGKIKLEYENMKKIKFFILLISFLFVGAIVPLFVEAYNPNFSIFCFDQADCDNSSCPNNLICWDDRPGCFVTCKGSGEYCPMDSACFPYAGIETQRCGYSPLTPSCGISADPSSINVGQSSTLTWSSDANSNCTASNCTAWGGWSGSKSSSGSETVSPSSTTTYGLTCTNSCLDGSASSDCSVTVNVIACVCTANSNWCEGNYAWHCSSDCLSKWSEDCDSYDGWYDTLSRKLILELRIFV